MKHKIKFRAWDKESDSGMYVVQHIDWLDDVVGVSKNGDEFEPLLFSLSFVELMQYTGLQDKNGKEIYEGDILSTSMKNEYGSLERVTGEVVYIDGIAMFNLMVNWHDGRLGFEFYRFEDSEVIGNIHENPELIA